ncbi:uncharacterized protein BDZ99DRAFT_566657 [Mytilinidion resinicola]|uniref:MYND-type domain-containing protein n=1 Tax=Mytilinidion resinicola TaxID=574789 RepID=A0A6A6Z1W4_9PEZI|nr:uncharacterized protein BDZ99DRAFT_566657 [Mytilinidion resinicola]KAF2814709.1 hypothetical protein BDZ99DRAFT_566657 [Mytilinidion resinicola]
MQKPSGVASSHEEDNDSMKDEDEESDEEWELDSDDDSDDHIDEDVLAVEDLAVGMGITRKMPQLVKTVHCAMCNKATSLGCPTYRSINYCSEACQKDDWPAHELLWQNFVDQKPQKHALSVRAIYFPYSGLSPKMVWLPFEEVKREEGNRRDQWPLFESVRGADVEYGNIFIISKSKVLRRKLPHVIKVVRDDEWIGRPMRNESIR